MIFGLLIIKQIKEAYNMKAALSPDFFDHVLVFISECLTTCLTPCRVLPIE